MTEQTLGWCWRARKASCITNISRSVASMVLFSTSTHWTPRHIPGILWNCQVPALSHGESSGHILHSFQFKHHPPEPRIKNEWIPELWRLPLVQAPCPSILGSTHAAGKRHRVALHRAIKLWTPSWVNQTAKTKNHSTSQAWVARSDVEGILFRTCSPGPPSAQVYNLIIKRWCFGRL